MAIHPFRNLGLKALALGLATLLWLTVLGEHVVERSLRVPLEFRNVPAAFEIIGDPPATVDVRVRGTSGLLSRLQPGDVVAAVDLASARPGSRLFDLRANQVTAPYGVDVTHVAPSTVALEIERTDQATVPVVPRIEGTPAPGFVVGSVEVTPQTVTVVGPVSRLRTLRQATTETVSVDGATTPVRDTVTIGVMESALRLAEPQSALVVVQILSETAARTLDNVRVAPHNLAEGRRATVSPATVTVTVRGVPDRLDLVDATDLAASVDLAGLQPGQYTLEVRVDPPPGIVVGDVAPAAVAVRIR